MCWTPIPRSAGGSNRAFEYRPFQLCVLEHRLDDEIAVSIVLESVNRDQIVSRRLSLLGIPETSDDSALDEPVQPVKCPVRLSALLVRKDRRMAGQRKHQRDFRPHHSRADDAHFVRQAQFFAPSVKTAAQEAARQSLI